VYISSGEAQAAVEQVCQKTAKAAVEQKPRGAALLAVEQTHSEAAQQCKIKWKILKLGCNTVPSGRIFALKKVTFLRIFGDISHIFCSLLVTIDLKQKYWLLVTVTNGNEQDLHALL
jgi:hypothetical protein